MAINLCAPKHLPFSVNLKFHLDHYRSRYSAEKLIIHEYSHYFRTDFAPLHIRYWSRNQQERWRQYLRRNHRRIAGYTGV
jgi:hypothetical protein